MFYEYALDPAVLSSWERVRYFLDAFGPWKGRFLVPIPKKWRKSVFEVAREHCREVELAKVEERLRHLDETVYARRPDLDPEFDPARSWLENAEVEHARDPLRAIITEGPSTRDHVLDAATLDDTVERWDVPPGLSVKREPLAVAGVLSVLIASSTRLVIVDPYFRADRSDMATMLRALCGRLRGRPVSVDVHIHVPDDGLPFSESKRHALRALPPMVPRGLVVTLHGWRERKGGYRFHNRFILTDVGGVQFGDSIERGEPGQDDRLTRLGKQERSDHFDRFHGPNPAFECVGKVEVLGESDP